jgi:hypothetical protein
LNFGVRTATGATTETIAEYSGQFLEELEKKLRKNDACVEHVYDYFGDLILKEEWKRANAILSVLEKGLYPKWVLLPFNTLSGPYQKEMPNRAFLDEISPNQSSWL